ncbi:MAG: sensor domain-containing diguanylate cyclase [Halofilum sp. (in: g-proteobacteria)]|nr:sensor domain-containing diguanylate cyclase [Halofilum sp. (in: g-proteobacteria)]
MIDPSAFEDFEQAGRAVLAHLHARFGYRLWMLTRVEGNDWIVLQSEDHGYEIGEGTVLNWSDSFCTRMVAGRGPQFAPRSMEVPAYAEAPIGEYTNIGAYIGLPLRRKDGELFGTLCAIDPVEQQELEQQDMELIELLTRLLASVLQRDLAVSEQARLVQRVAEQSMRDELTGLHNRRGWERRLEQEEARARRFGSPAAILVIDLDRLKEVNDREGHRAGDRLLQTAAEALRSALRETDCAARVGGDEFTVLAVECDEPSAGQVEYRLRQALAAAGVEASIGRAQRDPRQGLDAAWAVADRAMYVNKRGRRRPDQ